VRNAILRGSVRLPALRRRVNSGRLAQPFVYADSPIVVPGPDDARLPGHGDVAPDAPCRVIGPPPESPVERLRDLIGPCFVALLVCGTGSRIAAPAAVRAARLAWAAPCRIVVVGPTAPISPATVLQDVTGALARRYGAAGSRAWLIRPDGHIAGSLPLPAADAVEALPGLQAVAIGAPG
jgi:3-(3-hydroxy-phenyl)propionate hydroxylase